MISLAAGVFWVGYTLAWWGRETMRGCTNVGVADLVIPGRYNGCTMPAGKAPDNGSSTNPDVSGAPRPPTSSGNNPRSQSPPSTEDYFGRGPTATTNNPAGRHGASGSW